MSTRCLRTYVLMLPTLAVLAALALCGALVGAASAAAAEPQLAMGDNSTLLIKPDGSLYAWGNNQYGQLGLGASVYYRTRPGRLGTANDWKSVASGTNHTLALKTDGSLWAWGNNADGRLGLGDTETRWDPTQVGSASDWAAIAAGLRFSFAIKTDGTLWAWGQNNSGQLGVGDTDTRLVPTQVGTDTDWAMVAGGGQHAVAVKSGGTLWAWGRNNHYQLGLPGTSDRLVPTQVGTDSDWATVRSSNDDVRAMKSDGSLWAWGYNSYGQLGLGDLDTRQQPTEVVGSLWSLLSCADDSTLATKPDGTLWAWGDNTYGQLGLGDHNYRMVPTKVGSDTHWSGLVSGHDHVGALKQDGGLWVWGKNGASQLGLGDTENRLLPTFAFYVTDVTAPTISSLDSPTHPDITVWYANATPTFTWETSADASGPVVYRCILDKSLDTIPSTVANAFDDSTWTAPETTEGTYYFHVRAGDAAGNWSTTLTRRVKIDATAPVTSDDAPTGWSKTAVTVHLTASDAGSGMAGGVAGTEYQVDGGAWTSGTQVTVSTEGVHTVAYRSTDALGTVEAAKSCTVRIDTTAPLTSDDAPAGWRKSAVTVHLTASDAGSGVAGTEYQLDGGAWKSGKQVTVSTEGVHTVAYRSTDALGTVEAAKSCTVRIDTTGPTTAAKATSGRKGHAIVLRYKIADNLSPKATAIKIVVKNSRGTIVKTVRPTAKNTATWYSVKWTPKGRGTYRYHVYAKDLAGNPQRTIGGAKVIVR